MIMSERASKQSRCQEAKRKKERKKEEQMRQEMVGWVGQ